MSDELSIAAWITLPQIMEDGLPASTHKYFPAIRAFLEAIYPFVQPKATDAYWSLHKELVQGFLSALIMADQTGETVEIMPQSILQENLNVAALYTIFGAYNELMQRLFGEKQS